MICNLQTRLGNSEKYLLEETGERLRLIKTRVPLYLLVPFVNSEDIGGTLYGSVGLRPATMNSFALEFKAL
jgi:hypothetical protein